MLAVDTNIVVRLLTRDHPEQSARVLAIIERVDVFVSTTVLLETEWALRRSYGFTGPDVIRALTNLIALEHVHVEHPQRLADVLSWAGQGMDFADALHLASAGGCEGFLTFDQRMIRYAERVGMDVRAP